jgi:predicted P-loop ATPase
MWIAEGKSRKSVKWRNREVTWVQFVDSLRTPRRTPETMRQYRAMTKDERDTLKEMPGGFVGGYLSGARRLVTNVRERSLITLDADYASPKDWQSFICLHDDLAVVCYPTHSSTPEKPRLRWVLPVSRPMTPEEYPAVARMVASWIGIETIDPSTYDLNRLFYYPGVPDDAPYELKEQRGDPVDVDAVLASYGPEKAWEDCSLWPVGSKETDALLHAKERLGDPREKKGIVGLFCRTYTIEDALSMFLPDVYEETSTPGRYTYLAGSSTGGARVYGDYLYSSHGTDPAYGHSQNAFDLVRIHKFGQLDAEASPETAPTNLPSYKAMLEWTATLPELTAQREAEHLESWEQDFGDLIAPAGGGTTPEDPGEDTEDTGDTEAWKKELVFNDKTGKLEPTIHNAVLLLSNLPDFKGKLGYNPMDDTITVKGSLPWQALRKDLSVEAMFGQKPGTASASTVWTENDWPEYYAYFERLGFPAGGQRNGVLDHALNVVGTRNAYHPIRSYLQGLTWDGKERLDSLFIRWLGAEDNRLNRVVTRRWMMAAVDRIMRPGCQFEEMLITVGPQGIGKSKLLRQLARGFFTSSISAISVDKATTELMQGIWIAEIGELDAMRKNEQTAIKNFISTVSDRYRGAYARKAVEHPRQCVLAGTSNEGSFLRDETGERRYWIVPVRGTGDRGELNGFRDEVDQIWAEAVAAWQDRVREFWTPDKKLNEVDLYLYLRENELEEEMTERREMYKMPDEEKLDIIDYLDRLRPDNWEQLTPAQRRSFIRGDGVYDMTKCTYRVNQISVKEVAYELYGEERGSKAYGIGRILDNLPDWEKSPTRARVKGYGEHTSRPVWLRRDAEDAWAQ